MGHWTELGGWWELRRAAMQEDLIPNGKRGNQQKLKGNRENHIHVDGHKIIFFVDIFI